MVRHCRTSSPQRRPHYFQHPHHQRPRIQQRKNRTPSHAARSYEHTFWDRIILPRSNYAALEKCHSSGLHPASPRGRNHLLHAPPHQPRGPTRRLIHPVYLLGTVRNARVYLPGEHCGPYQEGFPVCLVLCCVGRGEHHWPADIPGVSGTGVYWRDGCYDCVLLCRDILYTGLWGCLSCE